MWDDSEPAREACCWVQTSGCLHHNRIHISSSYGIWLCFRPAVWCVVPQDTKEHIKHTHLSRVLWLTAMSFSHCLKCLNWCLYLVGRIEEIWRILCTLKINSKHIFFSIYIVLYFPDFIWKLLSDYNQANENCLLHISSTCWRDAVGVTKPQSSNRPVGLFGLLSLDDFLPRVRTLVTHMGDSRILLSCVPVWSGKRKKGIWDALLPSAVRGGFQQVEQLQRRMTPFHHI